MVILCFVRSVYSHLHASLILFTLQLDIFINSNNMSGVVSKNDGQPTNMPILFRVFIEMYPRYFYSFIQAVKISDYTTFTNFSMKYLMMCMVYTDIGGIK